MDYASNNCEKRARELLAPLAGACPDSVWESVVVELDIRRKASENRWANKIVITPKVPLIAATVITVITLTVWLINSHKTNSQDNEVVNVTEPVKTNAVTPQPKLVEPKLAVQPIILKKDSVSKPLNVTQPVAVQVTQPIAIDKKASRNMPTLSEIQPMQVQTVTNQSLHTVSTNNDSSAVKSETRPSASETMDIGDSAQ